MAHPGAATPPRARNRRNLTFSRSKNACFRATAATLRVCPCAARESTGPMSSSNCSPRRCQAGTPWWLGAGVSSACWRAWSITKGKRVDLGGQAIQLDGQATTSTAGAVSTGPDPGPGLCAAGWCGRSSLAQPGVDGFQRAAGGGDIMAWCCPARFKACSISASIQSSRFARLLLVQAVQRSGLAGKIAHLAFQRGQPRAVFRGRFCRRARRACIVPLTPLAAPAFCVSVCCKASSEARLSATGRRPWQGGQRQQQGDVQLRAGRGGCTASL